MREQHNVTNFHTLAVHLPGDIRVQTDSVHTYKLWIKRRENWFEKLDKTFKSVVLQWTAEYASITHLYPFDGFWYFRLRQPTWEQFQHWLRYTYHTHINASLLYTESETDAHHIIFGWLCAAQVDYETILELAQQKQEEFGLGVYAWEAYADFVTMLHIWHSEQAQEEKEGNN